MDLFITFPFYMRIPLTWLVFKGKKWRGTSFSPDSEFLLSMVPTHAFPEWCLLPSSLCAILLMFPSKTSLFFFAAVWQKTQISPPHLFDKVFDMTFLTFSPFFLLPRQNPGCFWEVANKDGSPFAHLASNFCDRISNSNTADCMKGVDLNAHISPALTWE